MKLNFLAYLLRHPMLIGLGGAALALFGVAAVFNLPIRSSPIIPTRYFDISTNFPGADAATVDRFVTRPFEGAVAGVEGVKYVTGTSTLGNSDINAFLSPNANPGTLFNKVLAATNGARGNLPADVQPSTVKTVGDDNANGEFSIAVLFPPSLPNAEVAGYILSTIVPQIETVPGIGPVTIYSGAPSLRVTMDPLRMQALSVTPEQIETALTDVNGVSSAGTFRNNTFVMPVSSGSQIQTPSDFNALPIVTRDGSTVVLGDVAESEVGFDAGVDQAWWNRAPAIYINAGVAPDGNIIDVSKNIHKVVDAMRPSLPAGMHLLVDYDESVMVRESLRDLALTLIITILLVGGITRFALGTTRAALAPFAAILLSLLGAAVTMQVTSQTLNLFTIIALVLAVGLVVDDAIVVVEDIFRRVSEGAQPMAAAQASVVRLAPVLIAISSTLVVAFLPLGFLSGLTAALFRPFALVLIAAFLFSLVIALTIVPYMAMWASRTYQHGSNPGLIDRLRDLYLRLLTPALRLYPVICVGVAAIILVCVILFHVSPRNLDPAPDGLYINLFASAPPGASIGYLVNQAAQMEEVMHKALPGAPEWLDASEQNDAIFGGYTFKTPQQASQAVIRLTAALNGVQGISAYVSQDIGLPGSGDLPVSINISGQTGENRLLQIANSIQTAANASGDFDFVQINPGQPQYQFNLHTDLPLAAQLGVTQTEVDNTIADALSGRDLGQVSINGQAMDIVMGTANRDRPEMVEALPITTGTGALVPLGTLVSFDGSEQPNSLGSWQGLPSINIQAQQNPGVPLNRALNELYREFVATGAHDLSFNATGPSETFQETNRQNAKLFLGGLAGLFFLLAAQFQSLRDPFVVITTVPLASLGPLLLCVCGGATLNIVTEIALLTVWGLIARQGILFVQVAHEGRTLGFTVRSAALRAAQQRFRPIVMITLALIGGSIPLILASGPQATIRYDLGAVLATGMSSGFLLSLFAVPAMYCLLHRR